MSSLPTDTTDKTAIDAEVTYRWTRQAIWFPGVEKLVEDVKTAIEACGTEDDYVKPIQLRGAQALAALHTIYPFAIKAARAEADHFKAHFASIAKINPAANAALDTARREWAKKGGS